MLRVWRHLHLLKRGGRAYDPTGANGTAPGELAVLCPACPYPDINLPINWRSVAKESRFVSMSPSPPFVWHLHPPRYLYYQRFGIDACFRFKRRQISSYEKDPELGPGFAYVVAWEPYDKYLRQRGNQSEVTCSVCLFCICVSRLLQISTCSGLSAIEHANSKFSKGYSTTGVVCTTCDHEFVLPEGAGQLQKGERSVLGSQICVSPA